MADEPATPRAQSRDVPPSSGEDSSPASAPASASTELIADPGPAFDPEQAPEAGGPPPPTEGPEALELPEWEEKVLAGLVRGEGKVLHQAIGIAAQDWAYTESDLEDIVPPLTRIFNRYEPLRRLAKYADPAALAAALLAYASRSLQERNTVLAAEAPPPDVEPIPPAEESSPGPAPGPAAPAPPPPRAAAAFPEPSTTIQVAAPAPAGDIDPSAVDWHNKSG